MTKHKNHPRPFKVGDLCICRRPCWAWAGLNVPMRVVAVGQYAVYFGKKDTNTCALLIDGLIYHAYESQNAIDHNFALVNI